MFVCLRMFAAAIIEFHKFAVRTSEALNGAIGYVLILSRSLKVSFKNAVMNISYRNQCKARDKL